MKEFEKPAAAVETQALEFPDWSGMDDTPPRITPEAAFRLCEEYPLWFPDAVAKWRAQRPEKCPIEFVL